MHEARLYPFDTYVLTTTLRAVDSTTNETVPITRLLTITDTSSFIIAPSDSASYVVSSTSTGEQIPSRDLVINIVRSGEARFFALMLFGVNWMLAHTTVAYVGLAWKTKGSETVLRYLIFCLITLLAIPGVRNTMPDAPGYDGKFPYALIKSHQLTNNIRARCSDRPDRLLRSNATQWHLYHHTPRYTRQTRAPTP